MPEWKDMIKCVDNYKKLGEKKLSNGTLLVGPAPHVAPEAWLHCIYPALTSKKVELLFKSVAKKVQKLPAEYEELLKQANGFSIFSGSLCLYGLRDNYDRDIESVLGQPFALDTPNVDERPVFLKPNELIVGSYFWDGSYLIMDCDKDGVWRCTPEQRTATHRWQSIYHLCVQEFDRLSKLFNDQGEPLDEDAPTIPT